jgi:hypothetical protein
VRLGYVTPSPAEVAQPVADEELPAGGHRPAAAPAGQKFAPGRTRETGQQKAAPPSSGAVAPAGGSGAKRPPRPAPGGGAAPAPAGRSPSSTAQPAAGKVEGKGLFIVNEDGDTEKIDKDIYIIGRSSKCDLVINSVKVSREHAIITRERGEFFIEDLGSANGTWYKGERIEKMKLKDGDEVFICDEKFKFVLR